MRRKNHFLQKIAAVILTVAMCASCFSMAGTGSLATAASSEPLPSNIIVGYWHNFNNGSTKTKLRDVNPEWDVLNVSFMVTKGDRYTAYFEPDEDIYSGTYEERVAEFKSDVKYLQNQGKKVCISLGGETGSINLPSDQARDTFLETAIAILEEYGFDGFDVDLEGSSVTMGTGDTIETCSSPIQRYLVYILHQIKAKFGDDFIISMAPEHPYVQGGAIGWGSPWGAYLPFLNNCRDILTYIHPQYYNNGIAYDTADGWSFSGYNANSYVQLSEMLIQGFQTSQGKFEGLRPDQVAIGVPCGAGAAGSGVASISEYQSALTTLLQKYPDFRGIMTWSTNWDEKQGNRFVTGMRSVIDRYGDNTMAVKSITANVLDSVEVGETVTWNASVKNATGTVQYDFDLYKDGAVLQNGSYGSSSSFSAVITGPGEYYVTVTAKDGKNTVVSKTSEVITAFVGELRLVEVTADQTGLVPQGTAIHYTAKAVGGLSPISYLFEVYNGSAKVQSGAYSSSSTFSYTPQAAGFYKVTVSVRDAQGTVKTKDSSSVLVTEALSIASVSLGKNTVSVNEQVICTVNTKGGIGSNTYSYYIIKNGAVVKTTAYSGRQSMSFALSDTGKYQVRVYVQDGSGERVVASADLTVA